MIPHSKYLSLFIQRVDAGDLSPIPGWFLTAGGLIYGTLVSRAAYVHTFFNNIQIQNEKGEISTLYEEMVDQEFKIFEFSDPPEILLMDATINDGGHMHMVPCMCIHQDVLISWGLAERKGDVYEDEE